MPVCGRQAFVGIVTACTVVFLMACGSTVPSRDFPTPRISGFASSGSIVAHSGQTISGLHIRCTNDKPAIEIPQGVHGVEIRDNIIGPCRSGVVGILSDTNSYDINVNHNRIHGVATGLWARHSMHPIVFDKNTVYDILGPFPRGQMVQLDNVTEGVGQSRISGNVSDAFARTQSTKYEDHINTYMSSGSRENPILIQGNMIRGGDSDTGAAITIGDQGGKWYDVVDNIVVAVPNTGIAMVGGGQFRTSGNRVYNVHGPSIKTASSMTIWNVDTVELTNNRLLTSYCDDSSVCDLHMGFWFGPGCSNIVSTGNNWFDTSLDATMWDSVWTGSRWERHETSVP